MSCEINKKLQERIEQLEAALDAQTEHSSALVYECEELNGALDDAILREKIANNIKINVIHERGTLLGKIETLKKENMEHIQAIAGWCDIEEERDEYKLIVDQRTRGIQELNQRIKELEAANEQLQQVTRLSSYAILEVNTERDRVNGSLETARVLNDKLGTQRDGYMKERDALRAELEQIKGENNGVSNSRSAVSDSDSVCLGTNKEQVVNLKSETALANEIIVGLKAENARLKAELADWKLAYDVMLKDANERLAATKTVPVVEIQYYYVDDYMGQRCSANPDDGANIKLTFTDGKLTGAEVVETPKPSKPRIAPY